MDSRIKTLIDFGDQLFNKRGSLMSLWQEIADNFYPERADFTAQRYLGRDFAAQLSTSYPILARRDLGNAFSSMLRPPDQKWFSIRTRQENKEDNAAKRWLEWATQVQRNAMFDPSTRFSRATKEGDHDFSAFGQCVISVEIYHPPEQPGIKYKGPHLLYRCWHLRDCAWSETYDGKVSPFHRKWKPSVLELNAVFKGNVSPQVKKILEKTPYETVEVRHVMIEASQYEAPSGKKWKTPYVSIYFEVATGHVLEEIGSLTCRYIVPRWQTVSGSQYSYSPATVAALPDARLIQAMTLTLLEAGEKAVNPPLIATENVVRSDVQVYAGGITWIDESYDERLGEALRPLTLDTRNLPTGREMRDDIKQIIADAFFLSKITLPPTGGPDMTAYEVGQRVQEYIRNALPLFEPMETEYNGALCEETFELLLRNGAFGSPQDMPQSLSAADIQFRFESPLHQAIDKQKGQTWLQAKAILADAVALDPASAQLLDVRTAIRDVLDGIGVPAKWVRDEQTMEAIDEQAAEKQQQQELLATLTQGGAAAEQLGKASQALQFGATPAPSNAA